MQRVHMQDLLHVVDGQKCHGLTTLGNQCRINPRKGTHTCSRHESLEPFIVSCLEKESAQRKRRDADSIIASSFYTAPDRVRMRINGVMYFLDVVTKRVYMTGNADASPVGRYVRSEIVKIR